MSLFFSSFRTPRSTYRHLKHDKDSKLTDLSHNSTSIFIRLVAFTDTYGSAESHEQNWMSRFQSLCPAGEAHPMCLDCSIRNKLIGIRPYQRLLHTFARGSKDTFDIFFCSSLHHTFSKAQSSVQHTSRTLQAIKYRISSASVSSNRMANRRADSIRCQSSVHLNK